MNEQQLYRRLVRRSQHRSRSLAVIVALVLSAVILAYAGVELVLCAVGAPALLLSPSDAVRQLDHPGTVTLSVAAVALVLGVLLLVLALAPAARARHELPHERMAVVIDDQVLAGAISTVTRARAAVPGDRVSTSVARRRSTTRVTPTSGLPLDRGALAAAAEDVVARLDPRPPVRVNVTVAERGVVGS